MRFFYSKIWRVLVGVYVLGVIVWAWNGLLAQIPSSIYVEEGERIDEELNSYLSLRPKDDVAAVFSEIGDMTYKDMRERFGKSIVADTGCTMTCYLLGFIPIKDVSVSVMERAQLYPSGRLIGIYEKSTGVLVLDIATVRDRSGNECSPAKSLVKKGDYIEKINGEQINSKEQLIKAIDKNKYNDISISIRRGKENVVVKMTPVISEQGTPMLGIWVKDDMAGIGTMTYYNKDGRFGALGHGIGDGVTGELLEASNGYIYNMELSEVVKGKKGTPGELGGVIYYNKKDRLGKLIGNSSLGIYGELDEEELVNYKSCDKCMEEGFKQEIELGDAKIMSDISGEVQYYDIKILEVDYGANDTNKGMLIEVTDKNLLAATGGIVQGMSGSPIIQNGKILGAVTHVLVNDPTKGYGIFIETMLEQ